MKWAFLILLMIAILKYEWDRGLFIKRYRETYKKRLSEQYTQPSDDDIIREFEEDKKIKHEEPIKEDIKNEERNEPPAA